MTVAIAAICGADNKTQTGDIILCTDTKISWGTDSSNEAGYKIYDLPHGIFVAGSDSLSRCHQFATYLFSKLKEFNDDDPSFVERVRMAIDFANEECRGWALSEVVADYGVTKSEFLHDKDLMPEFRNNILEAYRDRITEMEALICGFSPVGTPMLFYTNGKRIDEAMVPGFACIGSGEPVARDWLNFRSQNSLFSTQRTYYHVREAHDYAGRLSNAVSQVCHMLLLRANCPAVDVGKCTDLLNRWTTTLYPRMTDSLDKPEMWDLFAKEYGISMPSGDQKSEDPQ